jgi:hypothetical protein
MDTESPRDTASPPDTSGPPADAALRNDHAAPQDGPSQPPPDGTAGGPDAATTFCAALTPKPLFCLDFDEGSATAGWSQVDQTMAKVGLTTSEFVSAPGAMKAATQYAGADATGHYLAPLSGQSLTIHMTASIRVDASASGIADLLVLSFSDGSGDTYLLQAEVSDTGTGSLTVNLPETYAPRNASQSYVDHFGAQPLSSASWTSFTMTMTAPLSGGAGTATFAYGAGQISTSINVPISLASVDFAAGLAYVQSGGWTVVLDDVTFDAATQ